VSGLEKLFLLLLSICLVLAIAVIFLSLDRIATALGL
jgi:hypothetical protein